MSDKIQPHHLERKAILYVRQSSAHQVLHNRESSALQYAMRGRLEQLGWSRIETIDEDLGRSAAGNVERTGFDRMVAEVCLGKVGAVAAREKEPDTVANDDNTQTLAHPCPCCGGPMVIIETFERNAQPRAPPRTEPS